MFNHAHDRILPSPVIVGWMLAALVVMPVCWLCGGIELQGRGLLVGIALGLSGLVVDFSFRQCSSPSPYLALQVWLISMATRVVSTFVILVVCDLLLHWGRETTVYLLAGWYLPLMIAESIGLTSINSTQVAYCRVPVSNPDGAGE